MRAQRSRSAAIVVGSLLILTLTPDQGQAVSCSMATKLYTNAQRNLLGDRRQLDQLEKQFNQVYAQEERARSDLARGRCNSVGSDMELCAKVEPRLGELMRTREALQNQHSSQVGLVSQSEEKLRIRTAEMKQICGDGPPPPAAPTLTHEELAKLQAKRQADRIAIGIAMGIPFGGEQARTVPRFRPQPKGPSIQTRTKGPSIYTKQGPVVRIAPPRTTVIRTVPQRTTVIRTAPRLPTIRMVPQRPRCHHRPGTSRLHCGSG